MAENKKSFLLYCDIIHTVKKLSREQRGDLFTIILEYVNDGNPVVDDLIIDLVFEPIKQQLKRDLRRWENTSEKRREAGKLGGIKSGELRKMEANEANASNEKHVEANEANEPVIDNVTVNVIDTVTVNDNEIKESTYNVNPSEKTEDSQEGDFLNSLSKKYKISTSIIAKAQVKFEVFRIAYPGKKDGSDVAFQHYLEGGNLIRDIDLLLPALEKEKVYMLGKTINWKNLKTWINDKCWTQELPEPVRENVTQRKFLTYQEVANKGGQGVKDVFTNYVKVADNKYIEKTKVN
jgi:hypothetical protein